MKIQTLSVGVSLFVASFLNVSLLHASQLKSKADGFNELVDRACSMNSTLSKSTNGPACKPIPNVKKDPIEPSFCDPNTFYEKEVPYNKEVADLPQKHIERIHVFKLGQVTLAGLGVGKSVPDSVEEMGLSYSPRSKDRKYCTWYLNSPEDDQAHEAKEPSKEFNYYPIEENPKRAGTERLSQEQAVKAFEKVYAIFDENKPRFLSCAETDHYIALGCNSMKHRGPTVFGMLLAFSGCKPENALKIVNHIWGQNDVPDATRLAIIQEGYRLGNERPASRAHFQALVK